MGITFAWFRPVAAFISGVFGGVMVRIFDRDGKTDVEDTIEDGHVHDHGASCSDDSCGVEEKDEHIPIIDKIKSSLRYAFGDFVADIAFHFALGLIIAALITVFIPANFLVDIGLSQGILAMLVMIIVGGPMYICSTSSIPIALSLIAKGLSPGTAFVFLFMGPFTNVASISILSKKLGAKTTVIYLVSAAVSAIGAGYLLDFLIGRFSLPYFGASDVLAMEMTAGPFKTVIGLIFMAILFYHMYNNLSAKIKNKSGQKSKQSEKSLKLNISGMHCDGCASGLQNDLINTKGISAAEVSFEDSSVEVWGKFKEKDIIEIVTKKGYQVI